jgi:hypothetical protein
VLQSWRILEWRPVCAPTSPNARSIPSGEVDPRLSGGLFSLQVAGVASGIEKGDGRPASAPG